MNVSVISSYLVSLGYEIDKPGLAKFEAALKQTQTFAESHTSGVTKLFVGMAAGIIGAYAAVGTATLGVLEHVSQGELGFQVFAMRMFMSVEAAKRLKIAVDALGYSLDEIAWNPELRQRYFALVGDQARLERGLGPDYQKEMRNIRDVRFEFTRLQVEGQYVLMGIAKEIAKAFGLEEGGALRKLHELNEYIINNLPAISRKISDDLVPILKQMWHTIQEIGSAFLKFVGIISGDDRLVKGENTLRNWGIAAQDLANDLQKVVEKINTILDLIQKHPDAARALGISAVTLGVTKNPTAAASAGVIGYFWNDLMKEEHESIGDAWRDFFSRIGARGGTRGAPIGTALPGIGMASWLTRLFSSDAGSQLMAEVQRASKATGIPSNLIFGQWAHETGDFTNRGARQLNNLAGITNPQTGGYQAYGSLDDFVNSWIRLIERRYPTALSARTPEEFAAALKRGGYYSAPYSEYARGIREHSGEFQHLASMDVDRINVYIQGNTNMSKEDVKLAVAHGVNEAKSKATLRLQLQNSGSQ